MDRKLYDLMDWAAVEEVVYSESADPHAVLGPHVIQEGLLIQAFVPSAVKMETVLTDTGEIVEMDREDDSGFFACLIRDSGRVPYRFRVYDADGAAEECEDPYAFVPVWEEEDLQKFAAGNHASIWKLLGAHPDVISGTAGVRFSVWAPNAMRISVVGDFNRWDGRTHQMGRLGNSGVFQIFVPGLSAGAIYKYEIKTKDRRVLLKADPYAFASQLRPESASVVSDLSGYDWDDSAWMDLRKEESEFSTAHPLNILELHLGTWLREHLPEGEPGDYVTAAELLAEHAREMNCTHVGLLPLTEHPLDESLGYQTTGYYAPTSRFGTPKEFMAFVDRLHREGIGVILDWPGARFPKDSFGLAEFDGTALYEEPGSGDTDVFRFGCPEVDNFLIADLLFWAETYHIDGFRVVDMSSILYFGNGNHNMYGGGENLEGVNFVRKLTETLRKNFPDVMMIADGSAEWPMTTGNVRNDGLGFDYRWNLGWTQGFLNYLSFRPEDRPAHYGELTYSMLYQYSENYILPLSHASVSGGQPSLMSRMPGETGEEKAAGFRAAYGWFMTHPGKKLLAAGQEAGPAEAYVRALNALYLTHPALWKLDNEPAGFEWINCHSWQENVTAFLRKSGDPEEDLLVIINFRPDSYEKFNVGVPYYGTFREIFNSDAAEYGGSGMRNVRPLIAKKLEVDERSEAITVKLAPYGVLIFTCTRRERPVRRAVNTVKETAAAAAGTAVETASGAAEIAVGKAAGAASLAAGKAADAVNYAAESSDTVSAVLKTASEVKENAVKTVSEVKDSAVKTASEVKDNAVKTASEVKDSAVKTASEVKDNAVKTVSAARKKAAKTASAARKKAAETASAAGKTAVEKASAAKKTAVEKAAAAKKTAVKTATAAGKAAAKKVEELRGKDVK